MTNPDWTKAPEGATHYDPNDNSSETCWMKNSKGEWFCYDGLDEWSHCGHWIIDNGTDHFIERPLIINFNCRVVLEINTQQKSFTHIRVNGKLYSPVPDDDQC